MVKMRFISVICGLGVFPLPISIDNRVVCIMIKGTSPQFPINLNHLSLASLTWIPRTLCSYQVSCHLFSNLPSSSYNWKILKLELNTLPRSLLPPVLQPNSTSISRTPNSHSHSKILLAPEQFSDWKEAFHKFTYIKSKHLATLMPRNMPKVMKVGLQRTQTMIHWGLSILTDQTTYQSFKKYVLKHPGPQKELCKLFSAISPKLPK